MKNLKNLILAGVGVALLVLVVAYAVFVPRSVVHAPTGDLAQKTSDTGALLGQQNNSTITAMTPSPAMSAGPITSPVVSFVGPRENIPKDAPSAYGFWSFAIPVSDIYSRSGQPLLSEFKWLKENGWKGDVDLRHDGEYNDPTADDSKLPGFNELGFNYLHLDILDGHAPTDDQAQQFLAFVTNPVNQPVHVHCRGGYGRAGAMTVLYRYAVQGWPLDKAVAESRLFHGGISDAQLKWLKSYAEAHLAGSFVVSH